MCFEMDNWTDRIFPTAGCKFTFNKTILFYLWLSREDKGKKVVIGFIEGICEIEC